MGIVIMYMRRMHRCGISYLVSFHVLSRISLHLLACLPPLAFLARARSPFTCPSPADQGSGESGARMQGPNLRTESGRRMPESTPVVCPNNIRSVHALDVHGISIAISSMKTTHLWTE